MPARERGVNRGVSQCRGASRQEFAPRSGLRSGRYAPLREGPVMTSTEKQQDHSQQVAADSLTTSP
jgi:hypothetical protein